MLVKEKRQKRTGIKNAGNNGIKRIDAAAAGVVYLTCTRAAVEGASDALSRVGVGDHAAADKSGGGQAVF